MKQHMLIALASILLFGGLQPFTAQAGNTADTFSISPMVGGLSFEGCQRLESAPLFGARIGYNFTRVIGVEALFDFSRTKSTYSNSTLDFYRYGGDFLYHFRPDKTFVPYLATGLAGMNLKGNNPYPETSKTTGVFDYGFGFKYFVTDEIAWRADMRGLLYSYGKDDQHAVEYTTGLYISIGSTPVATKLVDPPPAPKPVARLAPAPAPPIPTASLTASPASITKGQNATLSWTSSHATRCEIVPAIGSVQTQGASAVTPETDTLYTLACTGVGGTAKSTATIIVTVPEPPKAQPVVISPVSVAVPEKTCNKPEMVTINFNINKHNIEPQYDKSLNTVGDFLREYPESYGKISGHADATGSRDYNQKLSERRANNVKEYIIKNFGIAPERLISKGYGKNKPIATNKTKAGRTRNRRTETNLACGIQSNKRLP